SSQLCTSSARIQFLQNSTYWRHCEERSNLNQSIVLDCFVPRNDVLDLIHVADEITPAMAEFSFYQLSDSFSNVAISFTRPAFISFSEASALADIEYNYILLTFGTS